MGCEEWERKREEISWWDMWGGGCKNMSCVEEVYLR